MCVSHELEHPTGIPQSHSGHSGAGTGEQVPQLGLFAQRGGTAKGRGSCWNGRASPQDRVLSSLAKRPALPLPQPYQNMHFLIKPTEREAATLQLKRLTVSMGVGSPFITTQTMRQSASSRGYFPLSKETIIQEKSPLAGSWTMCDTVLLSASHWCSGEVQPGSADPPDSIQRHKAYWSHSSSSELQMPCKYHQIFYIIIIPGVSYQIISRQVTEIQLFTPCWWYLSKIYSERGFKGTPLS